MHVTVCIAGAKGATFLGDLIERGLRPKSVFAYPQRDDLSSSFETIRSICSEQMIEFTEARRPSEANLHHATLIFFVGWQYLLPFTDNRVVVFHDSLLPKYRGFAPTVTALIAGETRIGVSAFQPNARVDGGPILAQAHFNVVEPARIGDVLSRQAGLMAALAETIITAAAKGNALEAKPQAENEATYSIWRGEDDYWIDWSLSAREIARHIHAVGYPYSGAVTHLDGTDVIVEEGEAVDDLEFVRRQPGKVWSLDEAGPVVICGSGLIRLTRMRRRDDNALFRCPKLRSHFKRI